MNFTVNCTAECIGNKTTGKSKYWFLQAGEHFALQFALDRPYLR